ncbi:uncharacterized protein LOC144616391 isoform X1 [Panthera onca]
MSPNMNESTRDGSWRRRHSDSSPSLGFAAKRNKEIRVLEAGKSKIKVLADSVPDEDAFTYLLSSCCVLIFERKEMTNGAKSFREWKRIAPRERRVGQEARLLLGLQRRNGTMKHEKICLATVCTHSSLSPQMWEAAGKSQAYLTQTWRTTEGVSGAETWVQIRW